MHQQDSGNHRAPLFALLYVSEMTVPDSGEVARICRQSRLNNERQQITGVLVFDGGAFCQFVEGDERSVASLLGRLEGDPRHRRMRVLQFGPTTRGRRFPSWRLGYAFAADPAAIAAIERAGVAGAMDAFHDWLPRFEAREA